MAAVQPRQRDAFMLTPSLTDTRLVQPSPQAVPSTLKLSQQELAEIQEAFTLFDKDNSGGLEYRELKVALRALGFPVKKSEVQALIARHGDAAGNVSRAAWEQICSDSMRNRDAGEQLARAFQLFDVDADGKITVQDLRAVARELGQTLEEQDLAGMIAEFSPDLQIGPETFKQIMQDAPT